MLVDWRHIFGQVVRKGTSNWMKDWVNECGSRAPERQPLVTWQSHRQAFLFFACSNESVFVAFRGCLSSYLRARPGIRGICSKSSVLHSDSLQNRSFVVGFGCDYLGASPFSHLHSCNPLTGVVHGRDLLLIFRSTRTDARARVRTHLWICILTWQRRHTPA